MKYPLFAAVLAAIVMPAAVAATKCSSLADIRIEDANLLSSMVVPAQDGLPEHCRILGVIRPSINFEIRLPTQEWNGKFYMAGCGGFCGRLDSDLPGFSNAMNHGLRRRYAAATMDGGHWGASRIDGRWAWNNRLAENDWSWRAVTETARVAKSLVATFYGKPQVKSYFAGCSTGGRMALMEAQRFPCRFRWHHRRCSGPRLHRARRRRICVGHAGEYTFGRQRNPGSARSRTLRQRSPPPATPSTAIGMG
jgi:feruloyl esterase